MASETQIYLETPHVVSHFINGLPGLPHEARFGWFFRF